MNSEEALYENARVKDLSGRDVYPHAFPITKTFNEYINTFKNCQAGERMRDMRESMAGRVIEKRSSGKKLVFYNVSSNGYILQFLADASEFSGSLEEFRTINNAIHRGDVIGANGFVGSSKKGELSLYPTELVLLSPCYKMLPKQCFGINDDDIKYKQRHVTMIANPELVQTLKKRSEIIRFIRKFLDGQEFIEVETPVLTNKFGGAAAKPFVTFHNDLKASMFMRIATELHLKQLVIGGLDRVYEIGKQFRNESIDRSHLPEFTSIEFYMAYADYHNMMEMVETIFNNLALKICGSTKITYESKELDFSIPFKRLDIISELEKCTGKSFQYSDYSSNEFRTFLEDLCQEHNIVCGTPVTIPRLLDKLIGHFLESQCHNPTFLINHPLIMSPLAKYHRDNRQLSERFELFVNCMELANAFTELNDHVAQENAFKLQQVDKKQGDDEVPLPDNDYVDALKYGLPPTGGCGIGIDRLVMMLTNSTTIRDVVTFSA